MPNDPQNRPAQDSPTNEPSDWRERAVDPSEDRKLRERRLKIRCWRRGVKEMDLILGGYFDAHGAALSDADLSAFEELLREDDGTLYQWVSGAQTPPETHRDAIEAIKRTRGVA